LHLASKEGLEPLDPIFVLVGVVKAVLVVHVKDQDRGHLGVGLAGLDDASQHQPGEKAFAGAGGAKDAAGALDKAGQVYADRVFLFQRVTDDELARFILAKDLCHVTGVRQADRRVMSGHGFDRPGRGPLHQPRFDILLPTQVFLEIVRPPI